MRHLAINRRLLELAGGERQHLQYDGWPLVERPDRPDPATDRAVDQRVHHSDELRPIRSAVYLEILVDVTPRPGVLLLHDGDSRQLEDGRREVRVERVRPLEVEPRQRRV